MVRKRLTIALMMKFIGLVALNMALYPGLVALGPASPVLCFLFVAINLVGVQALLLGRRPEAFHFTFLLVGILWSILLTVVSVGWSAPWQYAASASGILVPWVIGLFVAGRIQRLDETLLRRPHVIVAYIEGAVIGFAGFSLAAIVAAWMTPEAPLAHTARWYAHLIGLVVCPILGGASVARMAQAAKGRARLGEPRAISTTQQGD
jgi:hypothetical protein